MNRPAVFFDRDNTLIVSDGYLGDPDDVVLVDGAAEAVARVRALGFAAVTFSNQSGVARGKFGEEAVHAVNSRLDDLMQEDNPSATIDRHEFCPYHPAATVDRYRQDSDLRKPRPGMIYQAAQKLGLDLSRSWVIGDAPRDIAAGRTAGCRTILLTIPSLPPSIAVREASEIEPDFSATTLAEAIDLIERHGKPSDETIAEPAVVIASSSAGSTASATAGRATIERSTAAAASNRSKSLFAESSASTAESDTVAEAVSQAEAAAAEAIRAKATWGDRMRAARSQKTASGGGSSESDDSSASESSASAATQSPPARIEEPSRNVEPQRMSRSVSTAESTPRTTAAPIVIELSPEPTREPEPVRMPKRSIELTVPAAAVEEKAQSQTEAETESEAVPEIETPTSRLEHLAEQILEELRRRHDEPSDFSVTKLIAGILQVLTVATFAYAYIICYIIRGADPANLHSVLLFAIALQTLTISLLIMGKQK